MKKKIEFWDVGCVVKQYGIIDKVAFWDGKIGCDFRSHFLIKCS